MKTGEKIEIETETRKLALVVIFLSVFVLTLFSLAPHIQGFG